MKLTKTELALLARANDGTRRSGVTYGYRTGRKNGGFGGREADALAKLVKKGLVRVTSSESRVDSGPLFSDHCTDTAYELTEAANAVLKPKPEGV